MRTALPLLCLLVLLVPACGDGAQKKVDRSNDQAVVRGLLGALARSDLETVRRLMTPAAWGQFEREMRQFRRTLLDEKDGARFRARGREVLGDEVAAALARVRDGGVEATWRFTLALRPMEDPPRLAGMSLDGKDPQRRQWFYWSGRIRRPVTLILSEGSWQVSSVGLH